MSTNPVAEAEILEPEVEHISKIYMMFGLVGLLMLVIAAGLDHFHHAYWSLVPLGLAVLALLTSAVLFLIGYTARQKLKRDLLITMPKE